MRHPRLRPWLLVLAAAGTLALVLTTSCQQQQEGERCDQNNGISGGDSDCNDPLVCTPAKDLGTDTDRCCPADRTQATVAPCIISSSTLPQSPVPPEGGTTDGSTFSTDSGGGTDSGSSTDTGVADAADSG